MAAQIDSAHQGDDARSLVWIYGMIAVAAITALRAALVVLSPIELHGDEAQYWSWSLNLDWGYFSKPPLIAWTIAATTSVFGDAEWGIRIAASFLHGAAAVFLGLLARDLYDERLGVGAALLYLAMPAVSFSSGIMSTDALLLPCWSFALFALNRLRNAEHAQSRLAWGASLGVAIGLGLLAKYAMLYFLAGIALTAMFDAPLRRALLTPAGGAAALIALALIGPNLAWNAANDFKTVGHTADNANWSGQLFNVEALGEFWGEQFAVFGPFTLLLLAGAGIGAFRRVGEERRKLLFLLAFTAPPLVIVSIQAFISRAHANWAAAAYAAATVLVLAWAFGPDGAWSRLAKAGSARARQAFATFAAIAIAFNVAGGAIVTVGGTSLDLADNLCAPGSQTTCVGRAFKRARGWGDTLALVERQYELGHQGQAYASIAFDNRLVFHDLEYYARRADPALPMRMWLVDGDAAAPNSHAEQRAPLARSQSDDPPVLVVSVRPDEHDTMRADFARLVPLGVEDVDRGPAGPLQLHFFAAYGYAPGPR